MSKEALIMMIVTQVTFAGITGFFFYKVLTIKPKAEPDSFSESHEDKHGEE